MDGEEKIPINVCSFEEFRSLGLSSALAGIIQGVRLDHGEITPELFESSPVLCNNRELAARVDFSGGTQGGESSIFITPRGRPTMSTPRREPDQNGAGPGGAYPYDHYPPPAASQSSGSWGASPSHLRGERGPQPPSTRGAGMGGGVEPRVRPRHLIGEEANEAYANRCGQVSGDSSEWSGGDDFPARHPSLGGRQGISIRTRVGDGRGSSAPPPTPDYSARNVRAGMTRPAQHSSSSPPSSPAASPANSSASSGRGTGGGLPYYTLPKSLTFDGKGNWRAFFRKFSAFADHHNWTAMERVSQLYWGLKGKAEDYLLMVLDQEPNMPYAGLVARLQHRFGEEGLSESAQLEFVAAKQGPTESLPDWADRVLQLAARAFPGVNGSYPNRQAVLRLCQGALNREAGCHALTRNPSTVNEALKYIEWHQHVHRAMYGRPKAVSKASEGEVRKVELPQGNNAALEQRLVNLERKTDERLGHIERDLQRLGGLERDLKKVLEAIQTRPQLARERGRSPGRDRCYECGGIGHYRNNCPSVQENRAKVQVSFVGDQEEENSSGSEELASPRPPPPEAK
ncbi:uncharacterized protein LOC129262907 [Lytechinus pictus]|uniref:uncharacterized protein LOC129262907 n=1 Tax=Lytechinus pictus TaxID=7653 RepID=UPI0030BA0593